MYLEIEIEIDRNISHTFCKNIYIFYYYYYIFTLFFYLFLQIPAASIFISKEEGVVQYTP